MKKPDDQQRNAERIPLTEPLDGSIEGGDAKITELSLIGAKVEHFNRLSMNANASVQFKWKGQTIKLKGKIARTEMRVIRGKPGYMSGVTFASSLDEAPDELRTMMASFVESIEMEAELPPPPPPPRPAPAPKKAAPPAPPPPPAPKKAAPQKAAPQKAAPQKAAPPPPPPPPPPAAKRPAPTPPPMPAPFLSLDDDVEEIDAASEVPRYVECVWEEEGWVKTRTDDPKQPFSGFTMLAPETDEEINDFCRTYEMADPETQRMIRLSFELAIAHDRRK